MNILHLHTNLNITCGISKTIFLISKNLKDNFKHFIIAENGDAKSKFLNAGLNVQFLNSNRKNIADNFKIYSFLKEFIKANNIQLIHSHHRYFDLISNFLKKSAPVHTVTSVHSIVKGRKMFSYNADILIAVSNSVKEHLISHFKKPENKIKIIHNFVDLSDIKITQEPDNLKFKLGIEDSKFVIGFIGRFDFEEKGVDILLQAMIKLKNDHSDLFLLLIGNGKDGEKINNIVKENNIPAVIINPQEKIFDYFKILNVFVLPSRVDPFPLVMLESGIMEVPFIGSEVDGIKELIRNKYNGLLFEKNNASDLAEKIQMFYNDEELRKNCVQQLRKDIESNYTSEKMLKKFQEIYMGLIL